MARSPYWDLAERADRERLFVIKADGATKELFFFGGRIAFLSFNAGGAAEEAVLSKLKCIARSTVGVTAGPSQALVLAALQSPGLDAAVAERTEVLARRYRLLRDAFASHRANGLVPFPFNSGVFALAAVHGTDAESFRQKLIAEPSVGVIAIPSINAIRIAYCSVRDDALGELVDRLYRAV
jgi:aspartate/methionine/tyrosine aminotransferase